MAEELSIISSDLLTDVSEKEVNDLINKVVEKSKDNMEEMCELTLECTTLLSSADSRADALNEQGLFKRLIGNVTGKNRKLQNAILQDNTNALYAAQCVINRVMLECTNNRKLLLAINDRVSDLYLELKQNQNDIAAAVLMTRQALVAFYKKYQEGILAQDKKIAKIENYTKINCPKCGSDLLTWQKVCSCCGYIHPLKDEHISDDTKKKLEQISAIVKDESFAEEIVWDMTARKIEKTLSKVKALAEIGKLPGYTDEIATDITHLMNKCKDAEFQIAVVGVMKAGKSFLMNALIGTEIASVEVNPETAALTKFRSANGYYVHVNFYTRSEWDKLKASAVKGNDTGKNSLLSKLKMPQIAKMEEVWVGHKPEHKQCNSLSELQEVVQKYTSTRSDSHLFVSEVEVGVDKSIFNMPKEVVFVDTPGLKDPVKYRSNITRRYIKKAEAVLIALKPGPFDAQGLEVVTTVLDCTEAEKAYIVGTQKDLSNESDSQKYVANWVDHLVEAKRYPDKRTALSRIILTTAKMDLLVRKWGALSDKEKADENCFSTADYNDLESFAGKTINKRGFNLMQMSEQDYAVVSQATGISALREKLESSLIANYRKLKIQDIEKAYNRCKKQIAQLSQNAIVQQENAIQLAVSGEEAINQKISELIAEKDILTKDGAELKREANKLVETIKRRIVALERKAY